MASNFPSDRDRLEDVFQDEICKKISSIVDFKRFARSKNGLCLDEPDIQRIVDDNPTSVEEQKMKMLQLWKEKNGTEANAVRIRAILQTFNEPDLEKDYVRISPDCRLDIRNPISLSSRVSRPTGEEVLKNIIIARITIELRIDDCLPLKIKANAIVMWDFNGEHLLSFFPKTKRWNRMQKMDRNLTFSTLLVFEDHVYVLCNKNMHRLKYSDPAAEWTELQESNEGHGICLPAVAFNDSLYVCGGGSMYPTRSVEKYKAGQWQMEAALNVARSHACAVVAKDCLYCIGGLDGHTKLRSVEKFDEESNQWSEVEPMPRPTCDASAVEKDGILHVADKDGMQCMDIQKESWKIMKPDHWPSKVWRAYIHVVDDKLYVVFDLYGRKGVEIYHLDERTEKMTLLCKRDDIHMCATNSIALKL